jgi:L-alanine-DL-glutamate epimerase-like enolase superfamily enzyme
MRISDLEFYLVEVPRTSHLPPVRSLLVRLCTDEGTEGWGEGLVSWRPSEILPRRDAILPVLSGRSVFDIEELQAVEVLANPPLRAAVEMACWDVAGKLAGQPLCRLWGGEYRQRIPVAARLNGRWPQRIAYLARELSVHGFHAQVITATGEAALDRRILTTVREAVGDGVQLRIDAQASYALDTAPDFCRAIEGQPIQCLIDPLAERGLYPMSALARQTTVPLGLWRSVRSPSDFLAVARCDAAAHVILDAEPLEVTGGMMTVPDGPGLGVEVDRGKVDRFVVEG